MSSRLLLIDGHSMAYRAFFALPAENFTTANGQHTNAIYGFATMLISLLKEEKPTHIAVAFDVSRKTFRTEKFPEYKANRAATPDEFRSQMSHLRELVSAFGIVQFEREGFEADDILATLATHAEREGMDVLLCSGDRDCFQLVTEKVTVLYPRKGVSDLARMTPEVVFEKYGMEPKSYPEFAALRGDPSDNLPSIPGVGEKTAAKWVVEYGTLSNLIANVEKITGKVGDSLRSNIDIALRNRELTQLLHDVPLGVEIEDLTWRGLDESKLSALFDELEFRTLKERIKSLLPKNDVPMKEATEPLMMLSFDEHLDVISPDEASKKIAGHVGSLGIIFEIKEEKLHRYAVAFSQTESFLVYSSKMGDWISNPQIPKILHDAKSLARIVPIWGIEFDTSLAAYLVNPGSRAQELPDLVQRWGDGESLDETTSEEGFLKGARSLFGLKKSLTTEMSQRGVLQLFTDLELPIAELLARMERRGIEVDRKKLEALQRFFVREVERETAAAFEVVGHEFNIASPKQLQVVLFDELKLPKTKKIKTGYTTDAESLEWLSQTTKHPVLTHLLRIREANKLRTTIDGLIAEISADGRIHTHFQQTVAATGRLSSTGPNLQNIPVRTEEGRKIRDCFIAAKDYETLLTADYSQIEMRIMAHLSNDEHLLAAFESGEDLHSSVASEVFGVPASEVTPEMRRQIKAMSYGLAYGLSSFGLSAQLGISPPEAQGLMDKYFERFGGIRDYLNTVVDEARKVGYTETILGRRRYLPDLTNENRQRREVAERMALNAPIQGSAADIIKRAMLNVESAITLRKIKSRLLLQVHDELIFEVFPGEVDALSQLVRNEMGSAYPLKAPLEVSIGLGKSWNEAAH
ncbi:MAG: DNA polymerase I [Candidatus Nanopelagicaceae bacterium]|nr:DNA polymerase I [Candidatus Nanopelagicaceae bacterium]